MGQYGYDVGASGWLQMVLAASVTLLALCVSYRFLIAFFRRRGRLPPPPGPRGLPVVGSLLSLGPVPFRSLQRMSQQYGPIMFLRLGSTPTLVISSPEMAEMILKTFDHIMASRPEGIASTKLLYNGAGMAYGKDGQYGPFFRRTRKICTLEMLSVQRVHQFQDARKHESLAMVQGILKEARHGSGEIIVHEFLSNFATNNMTQMMMSKSYSGPAAARSKDSPAEKEAATFGELVREVLVLLAAFNVADFIPALRPLDLHRHDKRLKATHEGLDGFFESVLAENRQQRSENKVSADTPKTFLDVLLAQAEGNSQGYEDEGVEGRLSIDTVKCLLTEMLIAGVESTPTTVEWALTELVRHPAVLTEAQEELDRVVGRHRLVNEADIPELKFIEAITKEVLRLHPAASLLLPRLSMEDCEISGYHIPAGTRVLVNAWAIHTDPRVWERPLEFDPTRFLSGSIVDVKGRSFELLPFGAGRRMCPGMNLGLLLLHLSLAQLLHTFTWALPEGQRPEDVDMSEIFGLATPKAVPMRCCVKPRLPMDVYS